MVGRTRRERQVLDDVVHPDAERAIEERAVHGRTDVNLDGGGGLNSGQHIRRMGLHRAQALTRSRQEIATVPAE